MTLGLLKRGETVDRLLNGPTNEVWIDPWVSYLKSLGVEFYTGARIKAFHMDGARISRVTLEREGGCYDVTGDYYVSALPAEVMGPLVSEDMKRAAPSIAHLDKLRTAWMNGIQFYLDRDVPVVHGHTIYIDSPWALTSISQQQFWRPGALDRYGDGRLGGILSVDISDWTSPGILYGKPAMQCSAEEIKNEVWEQIKVHLNVNGSRLIEDDK